MRIYQAFVRSCKLLSYLFFIVLLIEINFLPFQIRLSSLYGKCNDNISPQRKIHQCISDRNFWKREIMYFILIDRFKDGKKENNFNVDKNKPLFFHGGDIQGIIDSLDYLQNLGVTALWLSPFLKNRPNEFFGRYAYHGYWPWDFFEVDKRFGTLQELITLREELRKRSIKLVIDLVVNHVGYDAPISNLLPSWFNWNGEIRNWNDKFELENFQIFGLPDFASHKKVVKTFFKSVVKYWMNQIRPDGLRLDAVKHVPCDFWQELNCWIKREFGENILLLGEMLHGDPKVLAEIARDGKFNSLFDFPLYYTLKEVIAEEGDCRKLGVRFFEDYLYKPYLDTSMLATFIDNHDLDRFLTSCKGDIRRLKLALGMIFLCRGYPVIMYGTESGLEGSYDKASSNRRDMEFYKNDELHSWVKRLAGIRKAYNVLTDGLQAHISMAKEYYSFMRILPDSLALIIINNSNKLEKIEFNTANLDFTSKKIKDILNNIDAELTSNKFIVKIPPKTICLFLDLTKSTKKEYLYQKYLNLYNNKYAEGFIPVEIVLKVYDKNILNLAASCSPLVIGSFDEVGNWNVNSEKLVRMYKVGKNTFKAVLLLPAYSVGEIKFILKKTADNGIEEVIWYPKDNIIVEVRADNLPNTVLAEW